MNDQLILLNALSEIYLCPKFRHQFEINQVLIQLFFLLRLQRKKLLFRFHLTLSAFPLLVDLAAVDADL